MTLLDAVQLVGVVIACYGLWLAMVLLHEAGHLALALLCGYQIVSFRVGPCQVLAPPALTNETQWRFAWLPRKLFSGALAVRAKTLLQRGHPLRYALVVLAGPLANLGYAIAAYRFAIVSEKGWIAAIGGATIGMSVYLGIATMAPGTIHGQDTDGKKLFKLLFMPSARGLLMEQIMLIARIREFMACFNAGDMKSAQTQLDRMDMVCEAQSGAAMRPILAHWRGHLSNRESLETCTWSPGGPLPTSSPV